jgi:hypothetical protein
LLQSGTAEAGVHVSGRVHVGGSVRVHAGGGGNFAVRGGRPYARPWHRHRWFGGSVWVGGYYYPRPYYYYYPEYVPSYYGYAPQQGYYPVQPGGPGVAVAAPIIAPPPAPPTFGIGVFAGGTSIRDGQGGSQQESSDLGALARIRLTPGLIVEGEIAKTTFKDDVRVDRRIGGSLIWEIGARHALAPYLLVGGGVSQAKVDGSFTTDQDYGEIGVGLRLALSRNLHLAFDVRGGARKTIDSDQPNIISSTARSVAPPVAVGNNNDDTENYGRARLAAILNF